MEENLRNAWDERRRLIAEKADAATGESRRALAERVLAVVSGFPKPVLDRFLSLSPEQREKHLKVLMEIKNQDEKERDRLLTVAAEAQKKQVIINRSIESLLSELEGEKKLSTISTKSANELTEKINSISPKIAHLSTLDDELNQCTELMDLPRIPTWGGVQHAVCIAEPEHVRAVNTILLGKTVLISFHTRGLVHHKDHEEDLAVDRNWAHYSGVHDYQARIARHLKIDMSTDSQKRDALFLVSEPAAKKRKTKDEREESGAAN